VKLSVLASIIQGQLIGPDAIYAGLNIDSRTLSPGELFVALTGNRFDGHAFIEQAKARGAVGVLIDRPVSLDDAKLSLLRVHNTRQALGKIAQWHRAQFSIPVIALTGSCGKTTTKEMLRAILAEQGPVLASTKSFNNEIGVPLTLLGLTTQHQFAVIEMGANHPGEIAYLSHMAKPDIALITNIGPAHLQGFGSLQGVINAGDPFASQWESQLTSRKVIHFALKSPADFSARQVQLDTQGKAQFTLETPGGHISIKLALPGQHNLLNALAAAAVASQVGMSLIQIKAGLENMQEVPGRFRLLKNSSGASIIDDTYNANPSSVAAALQLLVHYPGRHIFVMGDMGELGTEAGRYHHKVGQLAKQLEIDDVYTCGELTALTSKAFGSTGKHFHNQSDLIQALKPLLHADVTVLIKGSRSAQMEKITAALMD
jgi:UDP-N-acetylmuramoyl-tripeptide--D-alanyl-D-alanine ligase